MINPRGSIERRIIEYISKHTRAKLQIQLALNESAKPYVESLIVKLVENGLLIRVPRGYKLSERCIQLMDEESKQATDNFKPLKPRPHWRDTCRQGSDEFMDWKSKHS